jgi:phosphate transport system substrate-binding protein
MLMNLNPKRSDPKTTRWINLCALTLSSLLTSCAPPQSQTIVIRGSNTVGEELAPRLVAEFRKDHPDIGFDTEYKGTSYGLGALLVGKCDLAAASREVTTNEMVLAADRQVDLADHPIGLYSVAVVVNKANPLRNMTRDQVRDVFTGVVTNWQAVGGSQGPIHLCIRDPISGTYLGFRELAMENKPYALHVETFTNYADIAQAVIGDANAIGYCSVELATNSNIGGVSIDGLAPSLASVEKGQYPYARLLRFYTDKGRENTASQEFIQFVQSPRGQKILTQMGYVPRQ